MMKKKIAALALAATGTENRIQTVSLDLEGGSGKRMLYRHKHA